MSVGQSGMLEVVAGVTVSDPSWQGGLGLGEILHHAGSSAVPAFKAWWDCMASNLALAALLGSAVRQALLGELPVGRAPADGPELRNRLAQLARETTFRPLFVESAKPSRCAAAGDHVFTLGDSRCDCGAATSP